MSGLLHRNSRILFLT